MNTVFISIGVCYGNYIDPETYKMFKRKRVFVVL